MADVKRKILGAKAQPVCVGFKYYTADHPTPFRFTAKKTFVSSLFLLRVDGETFFYLKDTNKKGKHDLKYNIQFLIYLILLCNNWEKV